MKKKGVVLMAATMLVLAASAVWAVPTINIYDLEETNPTVTSSGFNDIPIISNPIVATLPEFASITGFLCANFINNGKAAAYGIEMLEPASDPSGTSVSDFSILLVSPKIPIINSQAFELLFWSDGAAGYNLALAAFELKFPNAPQILEEPNLQNLWTFDGLVVNAQSCVPIPPSFLLLASGVLGMGIWRLRRKA